MRKYNELLPSAHMRLLFLAVIFPQMSAGLPDEAEIPCRGT